MEEKGIYATETSNDIVCCPECGVVVGTLVVYASQEWLQIGQIVVRNLHGACRLCGHEFHWSAPDKVLAELIRRVLESRNHQ